MYLLFDIGGTNMRVTFSPGAEEGVQDEIGKVAILDTPQDPKEAVEMFVQKAKEISEGQKTVGCAGGIAGILGNGVLLDSPNLPRWSGFNLAEEIKKGLSLEDDVLLKNDADMAGLGEAVYGAGRDFNILGYLSAGTGFGGSKIVQREIEGADSGFEPGRSIIELKSKRTLEDIAGGKNIEERYGDKEGLIEDREVWNEAAVAYGVGIYNASVHWSPEIIILGGSIFLDDKVYDKVIEEAELLFEENNFPMPKMSQANLGSGAALWGALHYLKTKNQ